MNSTTIEQVANPLLHCKYIPEKKWHVWFDTNNVIIKTISSIFELSNLETNIPGESDLTAVNIGHVSEPLFNVLNKVTQKPYYIGIIDQQNQEIYHYKFKNKISGADKIDDRYPLKLNSTLHVKAMLLDEHDADVTGQATTYSIKCIGTKTINKQYRLTSKQQTLNKKQGTSREFEIDIDDTLLIENIGIETAVSLRFTQPYKINDDIYNLTRYITITTDD